MKLAIPFKLNNEKNDTVANEFNIKFTKKNSVERLIIFLKKYPYHRVNIEFEGKVDKSVLVAARAVHPNIAARLRSVDAANETLLQELKNSKVKFFFDYNEMAAYNNASLENLIALGVSDIYLLDDLCFSLDKVRKVCDEKHIQIRMVLNRVHSTTLDKNFNPKAPMFIPQLFDALDQFVDVAEFDCGSPYNWTYHKVLYKAWFKEKYWLGSLSEINLDLGITYPCSCFVPRMLLPKLTCGRKCALQGKNGCKKCELSLEIANTFMDKSISFKMK